MGDGGGPESLNRTLHVCIEGDDAADGSKDRPLKTISAAAQLAMPGDTVLVHQGIYRERIDPPRGGVSDTQRITYRAAAGESVIIKGSERMTGWQRVCNDTWHVVIPNSFFGGFNPYCDVIKGDWFIPKDRTHHTGAVYLNGDGLLESESLRATLAPPAADGALLWFAAVDADFTLLWAQFKNVDPNQELVEINVRQSVFYPSRTGIDYLSIEGFSMCHAATPWAPPTAEQIALLGTHWSKGWRIVANRISHSRCCGISLGKYGDEFDNTSQWAADGYVKTIQRAQANGWSVDRIGSHVVRGNRISHCEQAGIIGSMGCNNSKVVGNVIHDIHVIGAFDGHEQAGIKFHGAIDTEISGNHIYNTVRGLWLDWMTQGTTVTGNLFHDNAVHDVFMEVNHGPFLFANNIFLSRQALDIWSNGGAYVHNLIAGEVLVRDDMWQRWTPYMKPHSTQIDGLKRVGIGDDRWINNVFLGPVDLGAYARANLPVFASGNVYSEQATPVPQENAPCIRGQCALARLALTADGWYLEGLQALRDAGGSGCRLVDTDLLGKIQAGQPFESPEGAPLRLDFDYYGNRRNSDCPVAGPFEMQFQDENRIKLWPQWSSKSNEVTSSQ